MKWCDCPEWNEEEHGVNWLSIMGRHNFGLYAPIVRCCPWCGSDLEDV